MKIARPKPDDLVVDTSTLMAMLLGEPCASLIADHLAAASSPIITAANVVELGIVVEARAGKPGQAALSSFLDDVGLDVIPIDVHAASRALDSFRRYGKGRHRAGLNFGDCFTHSLAIHTELPILCVGDDFIHTDAMVVDIPR